MAAAMGQAFSIQSFFIPVLKKNKKPHKYAFYTFLAYMLGGLAYYYIAYMGSFGNSRITQASFIGNIHRQQNNKPSKGISQPEPGKST
jgi:membrane protein YqaA with SNARE-associated domain